MRNLVKYTIAGLAMAGAATLVTLPAHAAGDTIGATVEVAIPVSVAGITALNFGSISAPTDIDATWRMTPNGAGGALAETTASDSVAFATTGAEEGKFTVTGQNGFTVTIAVGTVVDFADTNLTLSAVTTSPAVGAQALTGGTLDVFIGADLLIKTTATQGTDSDATIELTANY